MLQGLKEVTMHDGSKVLLKKLEEDYDPSNAIQALERLYSSNANGEMLTGLVHLVPEKKSFLELLHTVETPLSQLGEAELRPSREALEQIMQELM